MSEHTSTTQSPRTDPPSDTATAPRQASPAVRRIRKVECSEAPAPSRSGAAKPAAGGTGCQDDD